MIEEHTSELSGVSAVAFSGLAVECARTHGCETLLRGVRTVADFESEYQMALTNRMLAPDVETVIMAPSVEYSFLSSRLIKEVLGNGGGLPDLLPDSIADRVRRRAHGFPIERDDLAPVELVPARHHVVPAVDGGDQVVGPIRERLQELGGRQPDFALATSGGRRGLGPADETWRPGPRPEKLPPRLTEAEAAAHAEFVENLGEDALWKRFEA